MRDTKPQPMDLLLSGGICVPIGFAWLFVQDWLKLSERRNGEYVIFFVSILVCAIAFFVSWRLLPRSVSRNIGLVCWVTLPALVWIAMKVLED